MKHSFILFFLLLPALAWSQQPRTVQQEAQEFITMYNTLYQKLVTVSDNAEWKAATDVSEQHTGERIGAVNTVAAFQGSTYIIERCRALLAKKEQLDPLSARQLERILFNASHYPGTIPAVVSERIAAEARQSAILDGFTFCNKRAGDSCLEVMTPNMIDDALRASTNLAERKHAWEVSKQTGPALRDGLTKLQGLRNTMAHEMGHSSYFGLEVSDYGMTPAEMMTLMKSTIDEIMPLYRQLHTYTKHQLAARYNEPVPEKIPAHWISNRWSQAWPGIVEGVDLDTLFASKSPEWIVKQAESFYVSLGMPPLPPSFWENSDLYELPPDAARKKNTHASAWNIDYENDVRSLMSVKANYQWFETTHHELGHIYYYLAYNTPEVPVVLREGANRAFHEAIGDLLGIAARQIPYLKEIGVMPREMEIDRTQWLLSEALDNAVVFVPWSAGTMTHWEHDFYEKKLSPADYNARWWEYVGAFQGITPPEPRGEEYCDPATKTHINDDPAQYYDYALAFLIKYQLHNYIAKNILHQDPHDCNYYGNKDVGAWLWDLLKLGATRDWRQVMREKTGEDISPRAMLEYFAPVRAYLEEQNKGRKIGWE